MPVTYQVIPDIIGTTLHHDEKGVTVKRMFKIIASAPDTNTYNNLINALNSTGIAIGDSYPGTLTSYIECLSRDIEPDGKDNCVFIATVNYGTKTYPTQPSTLPLVEIQCSVQETETNIDANGDPITVSYKGKSQGGKIKKQVPQMSVRATRIELNEPSSTAVNYVGKVNAGTVQIGKTTYADGIVLCRGISGNPKQSDGSSTLSYEVTYEFQINLDGWNTDCTVFYEDPKTGEVPSDAVVGGDGTATVQVYPTAVMTGLNLNT